MTLNTMTAIVIVIAITMIAIATTAVTTIAVVTTMDAMIMTMIVTNIRDLKAVVVATIEIAVTSEMTTSVVIIE